MQEMTGLLASGREVGGVGSLMGPGFVMPEGIDSMFSEGMRGERHRQAALSKLRLSLRSCFAFAGLPLLLCARHHMRTAHGKTTQQEHTHHSVQTANTHR